MDPLEYISLVTAAFNGKIRQLNSPNYGVRGRNELFIECSEFVDARGMEGLVKGLREIQCTFETGYDYVYVYFDIGRSMYEIDMKTGNYEVYQMRRLTENECSFLQSLREVDGKTAEEIFAPLIS